MAKLGTFRQTTIERKLYVLDYEDWLEAGETVVSVVYELRKLPSEAITTEAQVTNDGIVGGNQVRFFFASGISGTQYRVEVQATTSLGQVKEDYVVFQVMDP
jgi:hypothetical protein